MDDDLRLATNLAADGPEAEQALQKMFFRFAQPLIHFARRFSLDKESAEDVVQNVFLALWRNRQSLSVTDNLQSYLYTAVRNQALNQIRHQKAISESEEQIRLTLPESASQVNHAEYEQFRQSVESAVNSLPDQCRRIFLLSRLDGLTYSQIATALGLSIKTVETQMGRALRHLRSAITRGISIFIILKFYTFFL